MPRFFLVARGMTWAGVPAADASAAAAVFGFAVADVATRGYSARWLVGGALVVLLAAAATALRTRRPLTATVLICSALLVSAVLPDPATPLWGFVLLLLVSFSVAAHLGGRRRAVALASILASMYPLQFVAADSTGDRLVSPIVIVGAGAVAGATVRRSRLQAARLAELAESLRAERAKHAELAALAERARIARDVHDIVAHSVSLMVVQAGAAVCLLSEDSPARQQLAAVRATGREALRELRALLAVLRDDTGESALPQPGIDELIQLARTAGARVRVAGVPWRVPPGLALTAYQVTREALTNARRHAPGADVEVYISCDATTLSVRVTDAGTGTLPGHDGHGLRGMRERAAAYDGTLTAGPREGGGWEVHLRLPAMASHGTELVAA